MNPNEACPPLSCIGFRACHIFSRFFWCRLEFCISSWFGLRWSRLNLNLNCPILACHLQHFRKARFWILFLYQHIWFWNYYDCIDTVRCLRLLSKFLYGPQLSCDFSRIFDLSTFEDSSQFFSNNQGIHSRLYGLIFPFQFLHIKHIMFKSWSRSLWDVGDRVWHCYQFSPWFNLIWFRILFDLLI